MHWAHQVIPIVALIYIGDCHVAINAREFLSHKTDHHEGKGAFLPHNDELKGLLLAGF